MIEFFQSLLDLIGNVIIFCSSIFVNGIQFFITSFTTIPSILFDLFNALPSFYRMGITGVFGLLLFVVFGKLIALIKL